MLARLHEFEGKALLRDAGVRVPDGDPVRTAEEAVQVVKRLGGQAIMKVQAWTTSRKAQGGVVIVRSPEEARQEAERVIRESDPSDALVQLHAALDGILEERDA